MGLQVGRRDVDGQQPQSAEENHNWLLDSWYDSLVEAVGTRDQFIARVKKDSSRR